MDIRPSNTAVDNVAEYCDLETIDLSFMLANRHRVEQSLCGMLVCAVAGVYYRRLADLCELMRHPSGAVPYDDRIGRHRIKIERRVDERFPFREARCGDANIQGVSGQSLGGDLKGGSRTSRIFKK